MRKKHFEIEAVLLAGYILGIQCGRHQLSLSIRCADLSVIANGAVHAMYEQTAAPARNGNSPSAIYFCCVGNGG